MAHLLAARVSDVPSLQLPIAVCSRCHEAVWLAPDSDRLLAQGMTPVCSRCIPQEGWLLMDAEQLVWALREMNRRRAERN